MSIRLRNGTYQLDIVTASGKRIRRSAGTSNKIEAQELHDKLKHDMWRVERMGDKPKRSWDEAAVRWIKEMSHKKSIEDDISKIRLLTQFRGMLLDDMSRDFVTAVIESFVCSNATKNRYIALVRAIMRKCEREWEWIDKAPTLSTYKEQTKRIRWLTQSEAENLLKALPDVISDMARFSLVTGLRQSNVLNLEWSQIDLDRKTAWIHADQTKSGRPLGVPLNDTAISTLKAQSGKHDKYVFVRYGKKLNGIDTALWSKALNKAGIVDFKWHDLRHTWASWMIQSNVPLMDLKELGGWETLEMVQHYAHLAPEHLHQHSRHINLLDVTNTAHEKSILRLLTKVS